MDGFEVCQSLKQDKHTRLIPVIFIPALYDRRARLQACEVGGDDFISKPFDQLELAARVKALVTQKRLNEDLEHADAKTVESRDPNTGDRCERLVALGRAFGKFLNLTHSETKNLMWGGYVHDIGKIGIPDAVLLKKGKLTPEEWQIVKQHVEIGAPLCEQCKV